MSRKKSAEKATHQLATSAKQLPILAPHAAITSSCLPVTPPAWRHAHSITMASVGSAMLAHLPAKLVSPARLAVLASPTISWTLMQPAF